MQDQPISGDALGASDETQRIVLALLLEPRPPGLWSVQELAREVGSQILAADAVVGLHAAGLVHRVHEFVFASRTAARFDQLTRT